MPDPAISPTTTGQTTYTITNSDGMSADLNLTVPTTPSFPTFDVRYPTAATGVQVTLVRLEGAITKTLDLLPGPIDDSTTFANRRIVASTTPAGTDTILTCEIRATIGAATESWTVRIGGLASNQCQFTQPENDPAALTITRVMCDPIASFTIAPGTTVKEKAAVTLTALSAIASTTVVKAPTASNPTVSYKWTYSGNIAITDFPACGSSPTMPFNAPGVYGNKTINISLQVWFDGACPSDVGFLNNSSAAQSLTIEPRTQHLMLVLDRSGSMSGSKWENAKTAARILTHLFVALRSGVNTTDRVGILVFEDQKCTWHSLPVDPLIAPALAPSSTGSADSASCGVNFGPAGDCTPIGDGLYKSMELLNGLGVADDPKFTIILLTDGYENSGTIRVDPNTSAPALVKNFSVARNDFPNVNSRLTIYTVGFGSTVQDDVLDALPLPAGTGPSGNYRNVTDGGQLKEAFAQMVSFSQEAQQPTLLPGAPSSPDPSPLAQQRYFQVDPKVNRLALAIEWTNLSDTIELAKRNQGATGSFDPVSVAVKQCPTHGFVWVDVAALYGGEDAVPATEWRVVHKSGGTPQAIADGNILIFVDLYVKADVVFDKALYRTGDSMVVTARLRAGDQPITGAKVTVELARPGESLGTFLATNSQQYDLSQWYDNLWHLWHTPGQWSSSGQQYSGPATASGGADPPHPKLALLQQLLHQKDMDELPTLRPPSIFADGTNELFDDGLHDDGAANDGNYANVYTNTDMEGTYTFRFHVEGTLPDGSSFNRVMTISKWVGVNVDPLSSVLTVNYALDAPVGFQAAEMVVLPIDQRGEYLGPFRASELEFRTTAGQFEETTVSHFAGHYSRKLIYKRGEVPIVTLSVQGKPFVPVVVAPGCLGQIVLLARAVLQWLLRLVRR
jgi:hypothetical protein